MMKKLLMIFIVFIFVFALAGCNESTDIKELEEKPLEVISDDPLSNTLSLEEVVIQDAAKLYCAQFTCTATESLTWGQISQFVVGVDTSSYLLGMSPNTIVAVMLNGVWSINLDIISVFFIVIFLTTILAPNINNVVLGTQRDSILADALAIENAAKLYCAQTTCTSTQTLTWLQLAPYVSGIDANYYIIGTIPLTVIATKVDSNWCIDLEVASVNEGEWEFTKNAVPSLSTREHVIPDVD